MSSGRLHIEGSGMAKAVANRHRSGMPPYVKVKRLVLDGIHTGRWGIGQCIPSLQQLVDATGASSATCKKAVAELVHEGILEGRQGKGVFVRSAAGRSEVRQIALLAWSDQLLSKHPAFVQTIQGMVDLIAESGSQLNFCFLDPDRLTGEEMQQRVQQIHAAGVLITHTPHTVEQALWPLKAKAVPIVTIGRHMEALSPYAVVNDVVHELTHLVRMVFEGGLRQLALVGCPHDEVFRRWRLPALEYAYAAAGRSTDDLILSRGPATYEDGKRMVAALLDRRVPPQMILADDDYVAYGALAAIRERGLRVPEDIQLLAIGGFLHPSLSEARVSALTVPRAECARIAAKMVLDLIDGRPISKPVSVVPCTVADYGTFRLPWGATRWPQSKPGVIDDAPVLMGQVRRRGRGGVRYGPAPRAAITGEGR